jgi:hypothetical protein
MIDRPPEVDHLAVQLDVHLVKVPAPVPEAPHPGDPLPANVGREHRTEPVPPMAHNFMADIDPALEEEILYVSQRQGEADIHHHHEADHLGSRIEIAKGVLRFSLTGHPATLLRHTLPAGAFPLTAPVHVMP